MARSGASHLLAGTSPARLPAVLEARSSVHPLPRIEGRMAPAGRRVSDHPLDVGLVQGARLDTARRAGESPEADLRGLADMGSQRPELGREPAVAALGSGLWGALT